MKHYTHQTRELMPKDQFVRGYDLLRAQPWGRRYSKSGTPDEAVMVATQLTFYYNKLGAYPPEVWIAGCELFAQGDHWPSVEEIRTSLNHSLPKRLQIEYAGGWDPSPEPVALALAYAQVESCSFLEGVRAVFPQWLSEHPTHPDRDRASRLYESLKDARPCAVETRRNGGSVGTAAASILAGALQERTPEPEPRSVPAAATTDDEEESVADLLGARSRAASGTSDTHAPPV